MPVYQVTSISPSLVIPPKKRARRFPYQWYVVVRAVIGGLIGGLLFTLLLNVFGHADTFFILLPVFVSLTWAQPLRYNIGKFLSSTPTYLLLTICWTLIYFGAITESQVLFYQNPSISHIIPIASAISWAIMLDPVRAYVQQHIERRFNLRDRETVNAIEAFTSTLREEIDLDQLRERFIKIIQQTMRPYSLALWIRASSGQPEKSGLSEEIGIASDDPLVAYMLRHVRPLEVDRLQLDSPLLRDLQLRAVDVLLPFASQGELIGLLILGTHLKGERYTRDELALLNALTLQVAPALRVALLVREQEEWEQEDDVTMLTLQRLSETFSFQNA